MKVRELIDKLNEFGLDNEIAITTGYDDHYGREFFDNQLNVEMITLREFMNGHLCETEKGKGKRTVVLRRVY